MRELGGLVAGEKEEWSRWRGVLERNWGLLQGREELGKRGGLIFLPLGHRTVNTFHPILHRLWHHLYSSFVLKHCSQLLLTHALTASPPRATLTAKTSVESKLACLGEFGWLSLPEAQANSVTWSLCLLGYAVSAFVVELQCFRIKPCLGQKAKLVSISSQWCRQPKRHHWMWIKRNKPCRIKPQTR